MACQTSHAFFLCHRRMAGAGSMEDPGLAGCGSESQGSGRRGQPSLHYFWGYFAVAYASGERCHQGDPRGVYRAFS